MGQGRPTSRPSNYVTDLEVLLETKNERIGELEQALHDEKQTTKSVIFNYKAILKNEERQSKQLQSRIEELEAGMRGLVERINKIDRYTHSHEGVERSK